MRIQNLFEKVNTKSEKFKTWFDGSKVVDEHGNPKLCYHGTYHTFEKFQPLSHFGELDIADYFSTLYGIVADSNFASNIHPVYLSIRHPLRVKDTGDDTFGQFVAWSKNLFTEQEVKYFESLWLQDEPSARKTFCEKLSKRGYDGLVYENKIEGSNPSTSWVIFSPHQVWHTTLDHPD
jgi:hypothetical protein